MTEPSAALVDFAIAARATADLARLPALLAELRERHPRPPLWAELFGSPETGEVLLLLRAAAAHYSTALRHKLETEAGRLGGELIELELASGPERARFYSERLPSLRARAELSGDVARALDAFRAAMGLVSDERSLFLRLGSLGELAAAWSRAVVTGRLFVPGPAAHAPGEALRILVEIPALPLSRASAQVLGEEGGRRGLFVAAAPEPDLARLLARCSDQARSGRWCEASGKRAHPRLDVCLPVSVDSRGALREEYATNLGRGGLFLRSELPPPVGARLEADLALPGGPVRVAAEVVHVIAVEEAVARGLQPGAGLSFVGDAAARAGVEAFLASAPGRKPRALVLAGDEGMLGDVLKDALAELGCDAARARDARTAQAELAHRMYELDLLAVDTRLAGLDAAALIDRVRRLSGATGLRVVALLAEAPGADAVIAPGWPLAKISDALARLLAR